MRLADAGVGCVAKRGKWIACYIVEGLYKKRRDEDKE